MLAGAHGIDVVALVIAADEGVMPQTREHFDICRLLGVQQGLIVITKTDLVEDELLELVASEVVELVAGSFLESAPVIPVAKTGAGLDHLKTALKEVSLRVPARASGFLTRLPVDRVFAMKGLERWLPGHSSPDRSPKETNWNSFPHTIGYEREAFKRMESRLRGRAQGTAVNLGGIEATAIERGMVLVRFRVFAPHKFLT